MGVGWVLGERREFWLQVVEGVNEKYFLTICDRRNGGHFDMPTFSSNEP